MISYKKGFFGLLAAVALCSCEKDDICTQDTPTTPNIVIEFYDANNNLVVPNQLALLPEGYDTAIGFNASKIILPLQINAESTTYQFILNGADEDASNDNIDTVNFSYTTDHVFISKACGFKAVFNLLDNSPNLDVNDGNRWIQNIEVIKQTIDNETETHVKIFI